MNDISYTPLQIVNQKISFFQQLLAQANQIDHAGQLAFINALVPTLLQLCESYLEEVYSASSTWGGNKKVPLNQIAQISNAGNLSPEIVELQTLLSDPQSWLSELLDCNQRLHKNALKHSGDSLDKPSKLTSNLIAAEKSLLYSPAEHTVLLDLSNVINWFNSLKTLITTQRESSVEF